MRYGLAVPTGIWKTSGYCSYPEFWFEERMLREIDPEGYADYMESAEGRK